MSSITHEVDRQLDIIAGNVAEIVPLDELEAKLRASLREHRPLRVKYGIDPTSSHIHIGHLVPCRVIRMFQDLGHLAVLIIGDHTARIGDPTDRGSERRRLSRQQVEENMKLYSEQLFRVVSRERAEVHYQSAWFDGMSLEETFRLLSSFSVAQMLAHETFRNRLDSGARLSLHELMYPVMQAYDSVEVSADIEIGGTDQRFNCLCGRDLQRSIGTPPQVVVTVPLLMGTDGRKMSKTSGNQVSTDMSAGELVGKVMSIPDELMAQYVMLATDWRSEKRRALISALEAQTIHPRDAKMEIARNIACQFHGSTAASRAIDEFVRVFRERGRPQNIRTVAVSRPSIVVVDLLIECNAASSKSEARRLIEQGGIRIDDHLVTSHEERLDLQAGVTHTVRVGKRRYFEITRAGP